MGVIFWDDKLTNSPSWNRLVVYAEWTEFYEIDQMKKMKVFLINLFIYLFLCNTFHSADSEEKKM